MTRELHLMTSELYLMTRELHLMTSELHLMTRELHLTTSELHLMTSPPSFNDNMACVLFHHSNQAEGQRSEARGIK